jgi:hypothetical protein
MTRGGGLHNTWKLRDRRNEATVSRARANLWEEVGIGECRETRKDV